MTEISFKANPIFDTQYERLSQDAESAMKGYLSPRESTLPEILRKSMTYSLQSGGKRLRPVMVLLACQACRGEVIRAMPAAAAIEMIHTYSLIHDDLPAMDNDDLRRGQPTNHKVFGEAIAILAGDALLTYAFHVLALHVQDAALVKQLVLELADAAGAPGMISGQAMDILNQGQAGDLATVNYIHTRKTAMMFRSAARMGGLCAGAARAVLDNLGEYGLKLGLAFQIVDDLLDVTATTEELGKKTQKDQDAGKLTYPAIIGIEESQRHADRLREQAVAALDELGPPAEPLRYLAVKLGKRRK